MKWLRRLWPWRRRIKADSVQRLLYGDPVNDAWELLANSGFIAQGCKQTEFYNGFSNGAMFELVYPGKGFDNIPGSPADNWLAYVYGFRAGVEWRRMQCRTS